MPKIVLLDDSTITKIAAGEVIERPCSVVKELVENSLDAGATEIIVKVKDAGKKQISVIDNGQGMDKEDVLLCTLRHATSKIRKIEDIYNIFSYGFRGEALATVAEVSKMEIISGTKNSQFSYKLVLENGKQKSFVPDTKFIGTTINVYNLFYNIPARQKFLKSDSYELKRISDWLKTIAISNKLVTFKFYNDTRLVFDYVACNDQKQRIKDVLGLDVFPAMHKDPIVRSEIYFTNPTDVFSSSSDAKQWFYINNRPIINKTISFAIHKAFENKIPKSKKPNVFVFLELSPKIFDVNVHPQKLEVRVKDDNTFFYPVYDALKNTLEKGFDNSDIQNQERKTKIISLLDKEYSENSINEFVTDIKSINIIPDSNRQTNLNFVNSSINNHEKYQSEKKYKIIGQYNNTFILVEDFNESLLLIDQHVAEERYNFEKLLNDFDSSKSIKMQQLVLPLSLTIDDSYLELVSEHKNIFKTFGFDLTVLPGQLLIRQIPVVLGRIPDKHELQEMILDLCNNIESESKLKTDNLINNLRVSILTSISCKSSVKADTVLGIFEMKKIVDNLFTTKNPYTCPHGRPIIIELTKKELYTKIGRKS